MYDHTTFILVKWVIIFNNFSDLKTASNSLTRNIYTKKEKHTGTEITLENLTVFA